MKCHNFMMHESHFKTITGSEIILWDHQRCNDFYCLHSCYLWWLEDHFHIFLAQKPVFFYKGYWNMPAWAHEMLYWWIFLKYSSLCFLQHHSVFLAQNVCVVAQLLVCSMCLTLILLTWTIWWAPTNASKWQMGFNSVFKGLITISLN